ncbi:15809_t:CDS:1, partial [Funneliformis mosseae]
KTCILKNQACAVNSASPSTRPEVSPLVCYAVNSASPLQGPESPH